MSKRLRPIPIRRMLEHMARELEMSSSVFSVTPGFRGSGRGEAGHGLGLELPLGVAAGAGVPMAQSLAAAYVAGGRFFELTTVSPSANLTLDQALEEYIKAAVAITLLGRELGLGDRRGAAFAMVLPADREALAGEELAGFLDAMADASATALWQECRRAAQESLRRFSSLERSDLEELDPHISRLAILTWQDLAQLDQAARCLLEERGMDVYIDLDPTFLGSIGMGACLAAQGGEDCPLDKGAFGPGLDQLGPVIDELGQLAQDLGLTLGLRLRGELPLAGGGSLRGAAAAPVALLACARAAARWPELPVIWAGETNYFNVRELYALGFAALVAGEGLRRPGGLGRLRQMSKALVNLPAPEGLDARGAEDLSRAWSRRERCRVDKPRPSRVRIPGKAPMMDCYTAPCQNCEAGCPLGMDITGALRLMSDGRYRDALRLILDKNPLPHITGAVCPEPCQGSCTRVFYDQPVQVREAEALCAQRAWEDLLPRLEPAEPAVGCRVAVVGGSPGGMAAAILLARRGVPVTLFEGASALCPRLREWEQELGEAIDKDAQLLEVMGVDVRLNAAVPAGQLLKNGYSHVVLALEPQEVAAGQMRLSGAEPDPDWAGDERVFVLEPREDAQGGVAQAIADAHALADSLAVPGKLCPHPAGRRGGAMGKKGKLCLPGGAEEECERCLECATVCDCCVDVCPNRANVPITVLTRSTPQILHLDALCDHCGLCGRFCPYESEPHRDKFTLFETAEDFAESPNAGFAVLDFLSRKVRLRLEGEVRDVSLRHVDQTIPAQVQELMETVFTDYPYLLDPDRRMATDQTTLF